MRKRMNMFKYYKYMGITLYMVGITILLLKRVGVEAFQHDFISGFATGLLLVAVGLTIVYLIKRKDQDFEYELNAAVDDERVINETRYQKSLILTILVFVLTVMLTVSVFYEFTFSTGATILLWLYIVLTIGLKLYRKLRKG